MTFRALLLGVFAAAACTAPVEARPPLWTVKDADSEIVIFGSVHMLPPDLAWRPPALDQALARADDVWFEIPVDGGGDVEAAQAVQSGGFLPEGERLSQRLSAEGAARLERHAGPLALSFPVLDQMRPWLADVTLATAVYGKAGALTALGVENQVAQRTPQAAGRRAFETAAEQIAFLAGAPEADQLAALEATLRELDEDPDAFAEMVDAWMAGDVATLQDKAVDPLAEAAPELFRRLVADRNARWTKTLQDRMAGSGRTVVVVGVGHLVGPQGVPARLRALGYQVEGP